MAAVIDGILSEAALRAAAGESAYGRAHALVDDVRGLRVEPGTASGSVQRRRVYVVELRWSTEGIAGSCTCRDGSTVCEHQVALGLAALDAARTAAPGVDPGGDAVAAYLATLDADELRVLVREMARHSDIATRALEVEAARATGDDAALRAELESAASDVLRAGRWLGYRQSLGYATRIDGFLDEVERYLDQGLADVVAPVLLKVATRVRKALLHADDSSGVIGETGQRAINLYARACREGSPDQVKLGRWLARFRDGSPGWPRVRLADFAAGMGGRGLAAYRKSVAAIDARLDGEDEGPGGPRFEINEMLLELADHDGDIERAIELLSVGRSVRYAAIVERLVAAGRGAEALGYAERAIAEGRVLAPGQGDRDPWSNPYAVTRQTIVDLYVDAGRPDAALAFARARFHTAPAPATYDFVLATAERFGRREAERAESLAWVDGHDWSSGAAPILLALHEGDVERAWAAADRWGAGAAWQALADLAPQPRPADALALYEATLDDALAFPGRKEAKQAVAILIRMRSLATAADAQSGGTRHTDALAARVSEIRSSLRRRFALMEELDRAGFPR